MIRKRIWYAIPLLFLATASPSIAAEEHVAVVCPEVFRQSLEPWVEHRLGQGYTLHLIDPGEQPTVDGIRMQIRRLADRSPIRAILLVGNGIETVPGRPFVPIPTVEAKVIGFFGEENDIASDNVYADLNDDELPELAIGRLSVDSPEELDALVRKIVRYETERRNGPWLHRLNFVAGIGNFSPILDRTIESSARYVLSRTIPTAYEITLTQADWKSPYCPAPNRFRSETINRLNEGCLCWVYLGHGSRGELDRMYLPNGYYPIFGEEDCGFVACEHSPIAIFLSCYTGAFDDPVSDSLAEKLHRRPDGPVAVLAASRTSMPYGNSVLGLELIEEMFRPRTENEPLLLGDVVLAAKRNSILRTNGQPPDLSSGKRSRERPVREMVDSIAKMLDPKAERLEEQRIDHVHLFNLFGDPLLQVPKPIPLEFEAPGEAVSESIITVRGKIHPDPAAETEIAIIELSIPKARNVAVFPKRKTFEMTEATFAEFDRTYQAANQRTVVRIGAEIEEGTFSGQLPIPKNALGDYDIRVYLDSESRFALGARPISIKPRARTENPQSE